MLFLIRIYQYMISPFTPASCRHIPTCSSYAYEALSRHGLLKGGKLVFFRVIRCHPWGTYGWDPVPVILVKKIRQPVSKSSSCKRIRFPIKRKYAVWDSCCCKLSRSDKPL